MTTLTIDNSPKKILIVGPFYDQTDKLLRVEPMIQNYDYVIFNGGLCEPLNQMSLIQKHIEILDRMFSTQRVIYNMGSRDLMLIEGLYADYPTEVGNWLAQRPNVVIVTFTNLSKLIVVNGGVTPRTTEAKLADNIEVSFVSSLGGRPWHQAYNGRFGYIVSNEPLTLSAPQFHNFSAQMGNEPFKPETQVYAQEADQYGLKTTILL
jgi:hypothetical protein